MSVFFFVCHYPTAPCCTQIPTATASTVTVTLVNLYGYFGFCYNVDGDESGIANSGNLFDLSDLFTQPCGEPPLIQNAAFVSATGFLPAGLEISEVGVTTEGSCMIENKFVQMTGSLLEDTTATCGLLVNTVGCNGIVASNSIVFNLVCSLSTYAVGMDSGADFAAAVRPAAASAVAPASLGATAINNRVPSPPLRGPGRRLGVRS